MNTKTIVRLTIWLIYLLLALPVNWLLIEVDMPIPLRLSLFLGIFMIVDAVVSAAYNKGG